MSNQSDAFVDWAVAKETEFAAWLKSSQPLAGTCRRLTDSGIWSRDCAAYQAAKAAYFGGKATVLRELTQDEIDARRYRRLQVLGCAPYNSPNLDTGTVLRFSNLDEFVDSDLRAHPARGESPANEYRRQMLAAMNAPLAREIT